MQHIFYSAELTKVRDTLLQQPQHSTRLLRNEIKTFLGHFLLTTDRGTIYHRVTRMRSGASHFLAVCRSGIEAVPRFKARRGNEGRKEGRKLRLDFCNFPRDRGRKERRTSMAWKSTLVGDGERKGKGGGGEGGEERR